MTATENLNALFGSDSREEILERDRYGRPLLPDPETGEIKGWTRPTTIASELADLKGLETWKHRKIAYGIGQREDLFAMAASTSSTYKAEDKEILDTVIGTALTVAEDKAAANKGTAIHRFTERADLGEQVCVPEKWELDVEAYLTEKKRCGIEVVENWTERILIIPDVDAAGTCDRLLKASGWSKPRIGDVKTGRDVSKSIYEYALQLAIYAHACYWYDPKEKTYHDMPEVDLERAMIIHIPIESGTCQFVEVDIAAGWEAVQHAVWARNWRKRKDLCWPYSSWETPAAQDSSGGELAADSASQVSSKAAASPEFACSECPQVCRSAAGLTMHMNAIHLQLSPTQVQAAHNSGDGGATESGLSEASAGDPPSASPEPHVSTVDDELFPDRLIWVTNRIEAIKAAGHGQEFVAVWNQTCSDIAFPKQGGPKNNSEIDRVAGVCNIVEMTHTLPFHDGDPAKTKYKESKTTQELIGL